MRFCKNVIIEQIEKQISDMDGNKLILRIEGFDNGRLYLEIFEYFRRKCQELSLDFEGKITLNGWEKIKEKAPFYGNELKNQQVVDEKNRITFYRNEIVEKKKVVLFFGTEYAEDKAGLNELFLIDPSLLEYYVGDAYSKMFYKYEDVLLDKEKAKISHFYQQLFLYVPKNLMHLSDIVDLAPEGLSDYYQIMEWIFSNVYQHWGLPNLTGFSPDKVTAKGKIKILGEAKQFLDRKSLDGPSKIKRACEKIEKYKNTTKGYQSAWVRTEDFETFEDFEESLSCYLKGIEVDKNRGKLCKVDFAFVNEILNIKEKKEKPTKKTIIKLNDSPLMMLEKAVFLSIHNLKDVNIDTEIDELVMVVESIGLAGVYGEEEEESTQQLTKEGWEKIGRFTGGLLEYFNQKGYLGKERNCKLVAKDNVFEPENTTILWEKGLLKPLTSQNTLSKMEFYIEPRKDGEVLGKTRFEWKFSEYESWVNLFVELDNEFFREVEQEAYIPFGIIQNIQEYVETQSQEDFFEIFAKRNIKYKNLLVDLQQKYKKDYPSIIEQYEILGKAFLKTTEYICKKGFYGLLLEENILKEFMNAYIQLGNVLCNLNADERLLNSYKMFLNGFLLSENDHCVRKDLELHHAIIPPYHPATMEKLKEKMDFMIAGQNELYATIFEEGSIDGKKFQEQIEFLDEISYLNTSVDVLKGTDELLICKNMFLGYGIFSDGKFDQGRYSVVNHYKKARNLDEDLTKNQISRMSADARVLFRYIRDYIRTFPTSTGTLDIGVINYKDFQPVIAAIHYLIGKEKVMVQNLNLHIYVPKCRNRGESYLTYWMDNFFDEDATIHVQTFLNHYEDDMQLEKLVQKKNLDIVFIHHVLAKEKVTFSQLDITKETMETKFPMFYKPLPKSITNKKNEIEISQLQFSLSSVHTKLLYKLERKLKELNREMPMVVKAVELEEKKMRLIEKIHQCAKWIVCVDMGLDKHVLFAEEAHDKNYKIIGFSTGEGTFGEYNVTVSAKEEMVEDLKMRIKQKLTRTFGRWDESQLNSVADYCIGIAKELDGSSLLKALNPKDYDINNFLAYILTNEYIKGERNNQDKKECEIIISLDAYKHWFLETDKDSGNKLGCFPDFLSLSVGTEKRFIDGKEKLVIHGTLIECKLAVQNQKHLEEAKGQIENGYKHLRNIFNPNMTRVDKRYWFSQLYRVLVFTQINKANNQDDFVEIANNMIGILDGDFIIDWNGEIYTFWLDWDSKEIHSVPLEDMREIATKQVAFGQQKIKQLLSGMQEESLLAYEPIVEDVVEEVMLPEEIEYEEEESNKQLSISEVEGKQKVENQGTMLENLPEKVQDAVNSINSGNMQNFIGRKENIDSANLKEENMEKQLEVEQKNTEEKKNHGSVLIGTSKGTEEKIYWNYGNKNMANRHLLITGKSGQGKTYGIQCLLLEFAKLGVPAIIFDYTEGFTNTKLDRIFLQELSGKIKQNFVKARGMGINPFLRHKINIHEIMGEDVIREMSPEEIARVSMEDSVAVASRIASILCHVYDFGDQQYATIYNACKNGIDTYEEKMNFEIFRQELKAIDTNVSQKVLNKLSPFLDTKLFATERQMDWKDLLYNQGEINVIQLTQIPRDMQIVATEFILWDMWYYSLLNGKEENPFIVVLDEAQNLDFGEKSPSNKILTEGRKFGWSGWFATQFLKGQLKEDEIGRLQQTSQRIYFRPPDNEITSMATSIDQDRSHATEWVNKLKNLQKGNCIVTGDSIFGEYGQKRVPVQIQISSLGARRV